MVEERKIVEGLWDEPVKIEKLEDKGNYVRIIGTKIYSKTIIDQVIRKGEIEKLKVFEEKIDFSGNPYDTFLYLEAVRFRYVSQFDPLVAMNISKIDPLPFQIEAVYGYILKLPRIRYLIADDPGAGKTIMAGLLIKELKLRKLISRILIVTPGHLKDQWIREMKEKFQETFIVIDRHSFNSSFGENPWERENQAITSIDFIKQENILPSLNSSHWDLIIVDEAHKMAAYRYGNKTEKTDRYKVGEILSKNSTHLIFLTATPHKGDPENFRLFLDLLIPGFFATDIEIEEAIRNQENFLFIRRLKEDLKDFDGKPLFTNRYPITINFRLSDAEKDLYNELTRYVREQYNNWIRETQEKRNVVFALLILQRRFASSTYAFLMSLERRKKRLEELIKSPSVEEKAKKLKTIDIEEIEDEEEKERWEKEKEWETITFARTTQELEKEIKTIDTLIKKAKDILEKGNEVKLNQLKNAIEEGFKKIEELKGYKKILIFTESKDTLDYLVNKIKGWGYKVNYIHGGMNLTDRIEAEKVFKNETEIMVATEAAGEGINLQFCNIMINYDIPWNPVRLEQRIGRIHRYGQQKDVYIFNLVAEDTTEGEVLLKILNKLDEIRRALGSDKVFDVIGEIFSGKNLYQLIVDAITQTKSMDEIIAELDIKVDEEYIKKIKEALGETLATKHINYSMIKEWAEKAKEYKLIPEYVEEFVKKAFEKLGGKFEKRKDGFIRIESIPYEIKQISNDFNFKTKYGTISNRYPKVTFDKEIAFKNPDSEFISFGHPLVEAILEWIKNKFSKDVFKGASFKDPSGKYNGPIWFFEVEIIDGKNEIAGKKIFALYDNGQEIVQINPSIIWDLIPFENSKGIEKYYPKEKIEEKAIEIAEKYKEEILKERERQAKIKEKYGIKSLEYLIGELDTEILQLQERIEKGEKVEIVIRNKEERKRIYEKALNDLKEEIEKEKMLNLSMPKIISAIYVYPERFEEMMSDEEIEKIGMKIAMEYERENGRNPEDVSYENLGFDIRSKGENEIRYIEVKARKNEGSIALTPNEWFKAKRFKEDYYLYIITNAITNPQLYIIKNPAEKLNPEEKIEIVRFIIPFEEWKRKTSKEGIINEK